jgi:hypothetical protein
MRLICHEQIYPLAFDLDTTHENRAVDKENWVVFAIRWSCFVFDTAEYD